MENKARQQEILARTIYDSFASAVDEVHLQAEEQFGEAYLDRWSRRFEVSESENFIEVLREFLACHVPFDGCSSMAAWALNRKKFPPEQHRGLTVALQTPYSIWRVWKIDSDGSVLLKDLLTGSTQAVLSIEDLREEVGCVVYAKIAPWENSGVMLSYNPFFLEPEHAQDLIDEVLGGRKTLSSKQLLEPEKAAEIYLLWMELVWGDADGLDLPEEFGPKVFHRLSYSFDPRKENWIHQALRNSPLFVSQSEGVYAYIDGEDLQAVLSVGKGTAQADCVRVPELEVFREALQSATGELLREESAQSVNLIEHLFTRGVDSPLLPGMPSISDFLPQSELERLSGELEFLKSMAGRIRHDEDGLVWVPSIDEVITDFLDDRARTVSDATFRRDERAMRLLRIYLLSCSEEARQNPSEYFENTDFDELIAHLPGFPSFIRTAQIVRTETEEKGALTTANVFTRWLNDAGFMGPD